MSFSDPAPRAPGEGAPPTPDADAPGISSDPGEAAQDPRPVDTVAVRPGSDPSRRRGGSPLVIAVAIVAVLAGGALFLSGYSLGRHDLTTPGTPVSEAEDFRPFWDAYRSVTERYAGGDVDRKALIEGAIKGMIEALDDPYSSYLSSQQYRDSLRNISGEFEGIGAEIGTIRPDGTTGDCSTLAPDCRLVIVAPIDGSPAERAGLLPGDIVLAADGTTLDGLTIDEARDRIRGPRDTSVRLTIERNGGEPFDVAIVRAVIIQRDVIHETYAGGTVGYTRLTGFSEHAADELGRVVKEDVEAGRRKLILDLRGNPGGFVTAAREIASQYLGDGTIFWQQDSAGRLTETVAQPGGPATDAGIRLIVLIDRGSASASEIVAGALQDRGRAVLVGEASFGKGTVQQWTQLEDDFGGFRLTVAKWLTPNKTWIHGEGITPDVAVDPRGGEPGEDPVLDRALELLAGETVSGSLTRLGRAA
jgi:carboxyl-terminal processing protease